MPRRKNSKSSPRRARPKSRTAKPSSKAATSAVSEQIANHRKWVEEREESKGKKLAERQSKKGKVPLSESLEGVTVRPLPKEVQEAMGEQDCVALIRGMAENDPNRVISRNYFRCHSGIKESTWNQFFGTFEEYKRQSGIKLTRQVHKLEREVAKHASRDHYRALEAERIVWGNKYDKPKDDRFQTILVASDFHDIDCDPFALRVFLDVAKRAKELISVVCLAGDIFDLPEFGRWQQDPRDWDVAGRIKFVHERILAPLRKLLPDVQMDFIEGNHEARLLRHLGDQTPAMKAVLSDLHGFDIPKLLGLDRFQINYIGKGSLAAWTARDMKNELAHNYKVYFDAVLAHHYPNLGRAKGMPGFSGHHHKLQVWPLDNPLYGPGSWYQLGAMHVRDASYTDGEKWSNGFALVHVDTQTKRSVFEYIDVADVAFAGGKMYARTPEECVVPNVPGL